MSEPFTAPHFDTLKEGDTFKTEGIFQGVTERKVKWKVIGRDNAKPSWMLRATYCGVHLGNYEYRLKRKKGTVSVTAA